MVITGTKFFRDRLSGYKCNKILQERLSGYKRNRFFFEKMKWL
jgi:hypothetical protein